MLEYISQSNLSDADTFMLVQATSPFTQTSDFNEALSLFKDYDSVLSCCESKRFSWKDGKALNYDIYNRPRRQDFKGTMIENGAFYISSVSAIKETKNRISELIFEDINLNFKEIFLKITELSNHYTFHFVTFLLGACGVKDPTKL